MRESCRVDDLLEINRAPLTDDDPDGWARGELPDLALDWTHTPPRASIPLDLIHATWQARRQSSDVDQTQDCDRRAAGVCPFASRSKNAGVRVANKVLEAMFSEAGNSWPKSKQAALLRAI